MEGATIQLPAFVHTSMLGVDHAGDAVQLTRHVTRLVGVQAAKVHSASHEIEKANVVVVHSRAWLIAMAPSLPNDVVETLTQTERVYMELFVLLCDLLAQLCPQSGADDLSATWRPEDPRLDRIVNRLHALRMQVDSNTYVLRGLPNLLWRRCSSWKSLMRWFPIPSHLSLLVAAPVWESPCGQLVMWRSQSHSVAWNPTPTRVEWWMKKSECAAAILTTKT